MTDLFFRRFHYVSGPALALTDKQRGALDRFRGKLAYGLYSFEEVPCLCGNYNGRLVARYDRYGLAVNTYLCRSCGIMWTNPRMTEDTLTKFYEEDYRPIYGGHERATDEFYVDQIRHGKAIHDFVASGIKSGQSPTVFDAGCGAGGMLVTFIRAGWHAFGCDVGSKYLEYGKAHGLVLEHGDVNVLAKYGRANLVILSHVLEHFPNPRKDLKHVSEVLADDGYLYVELPGILSIHRTYGDLLLFLQNAHLYHFTLATLTYLMSQAGFKIVKGDEYIHGLFQKTKSGGSVSTPSQYHKILAYLRFVELNRIAGSSYVLSHIIRVVRRWSMRLARYTLGDNLVDEVKERLGWPDV